jgi:phosphatidylcholine synthase
MSPGTQAVPPRLASMTDNEIDHFAAREVVLAWAVHLLTASGVVFALLAIEALGRDAWHEVLFWLIVALAIDGLDGTLARKLQVSERVPRIDGAALDLIVDYLNYVLVPVMLIWRVRLVPVHLAMPLAALILISSLYVFVRRDMKTADGYFRGFPALWNVVATYLVLIAPGAWICAAIIIALSLASFAPILVIHPFRTRDFPVAAPMLAVGWVLSTLLILLPTVSPTAHCTALAASVACLVGLFLMSIWRSIRGRFRSSTV